MTRMFSGFYVAVRYAVGMRGIKAAASGARIEAGVSGPYCFNRARKGCRRSCAFRQERPLISPVVMDRHDVWLGQPSRSVGLALSVLEAPRVRILRRDQLSAPPPVLAVISASSLAIRLAQQPQ